MNLSEAELLVMSDSPKNLPEALCLSAIASP